MVFDGVTRRISVCVFRRKRDMKCAPWYWRLYGFWWCDTQNSCLGF